MHLMARADAGIATINDLKGKKVNIANPGSGTRVLAETLMKYHRITADDLALAAELKSSEQSAALCDGKIDATIWAAGLPNGSSQEATSTCDVKIINLKGPGIDKLLAENSAYAAATIPGGMYPGNDTDIASWGPSHCPLLIPQMMWFMPWLKPSLAILTHSKNCIPPLPALKKMK